jgi:hypothetical protein
VAPRKDGVTKAAIVKVRTSALPGMSVRVTSHAIGAPTSTLRMPTDVA